jgi:hypothetical protein
VNRKAYASYRWFRFHNDAFNDPKLLRLSDRLHRLWIGLLCIASKNEGVLRSTDDMAIMLRTTPAVLERDIGRLVAARLIDDHEGMLTPHNWGKWQPKSDGTDPTASARMRRYRERQRNDRNATVTVIRPNGANIAIQIRMCPLAGRIDQFAMIDLIEVSRNADA